MKEKLEKKNGVFGVRDHILVQNYGALGENVCHSSPTEGTYIAFLALKRKIVHRIIRNNQFAVEIVKLLALGDRSKDKIGVIEWEPSIFNKNMGLLGDSGAENEDLNSPTYAAPPKWECPHA